jgi:hypothetical protein
VEDINIFPFSSSSMGFLGQVDIANFVFRFSSISEGDGFKNSANFTVEAGQEVLQQPCGTVIYSTTLLSLGTYDCSALSFLKML